MILQQTIYEPKVVDVEITLPAFYFEKGVFLSDVYYGIYEDKVIVIHDNPDAPGMRVFKDQTKSVHTDTVYKATKGLQTTEEAFLAAKKRYEENVQ
jgi:hypothetical protein